ncbi:60S ribosomal protein L6 [Globodera pallida]|uniref:Large ribosomal subunit protein eL6 n=1 Tax=Globodera pallida TaxID=36090 RepID=A0A183C9N4_GLOPA|nr:60S ribosomal protein L6 [Globodera pallida]
MTGKTTPRMPRNYQIAPGLQRFSKARMFHAKGMWIKLNKPFEKKTKQVQEAEKFVVKKIGGEKNGGERKVLKKKEPKLLPQVPTIQMKAKNRSKKVPLRKSITPGTILIILAGRHRGKRVVFLKQLPKSGLLLVTGPLKLNATPLRRIAQAFVIATKTKLDITSVNVPEHLDDSYFKRHSNKVADKSKAGIFAEGTKQRYAVSDQRKQDQKSMDSQVLEVIRKHSEKKFLFGYLGSRFHLAKGMHPHKMVF